MRPKASVTALLALATIFSVEVAYASPEDAATAETLFSSGKEAMARGDLVTACARLTESLRLDPAIGTLLNLATCEERSGKLVSALERFKSAREQLPQDDFRVRFTSERIQALSRRVARLTLRGPARAEPGVRVLRDGIELAPAAWNVPLPVDPGTHAIVVERGDAPAVRIAVDLTEGEDKAIDLPAAPAAWKPRGAEAVRERPTTTGPTPAAFVLGGVGLAGLAVGAVTGIVAIEAASEYRDHCTNGECDDAGLSAARTGRTMSVVSPVAFAVGGVGTALGVYLFVSTRSPKQASVRVTVGPSGVVLTRSF